MSEELTGMRDDNTDKQSDSAEQSESALLSGDLQKNSLDDIEELPELSDIQAFTAVESNDKTNLELLNTRESAENAENKEAGKSEDFSEDEVSQIDPLMKRPRISSIIWCVAFAVVFLASAVGLWFISVQTVLGQSYEEMVIDGFGSRGVPQWFAFCLKPFSMSLVVIAIGVIIALCAIVVTCVRKRWWLLGQCAAVSYTHLTLPTN